MANDEVLSREEVDDTLGQMQEVDIRYAPSVMRDLRNRLLAHDAALRSRVERLEGALQDALEQIEANFDTGREFADHKIDELHGLYRATRYASARLRDRMDALETRRTRREGEDDG